MVSVGGNDIALQPLCCTVASILSLVWCGGPLCCIEDLGVACPPNTYCVGDLGCLCCGLPNCLSSTLCGWPLGLGYMVDLFGNRVQNYVSRLVAHRKPKKVIICMIYYLDQKSTGSWADGALSCLCYDACPWRLQSGIAKAFELATSKIAIPGVEVVPVHLFRVLDGTRTADY